MGAAVVVNFPVVVALAVVVDAPVVDGAWSAGSGV